MSRTLFLGWVSLCLLARTAEACVSSGRDAGQTVGYDKIFINTSGLPSSIRDYVQPAAGLWNDSDCNQAVPNAHYTYQFPILSVDYSQGTGRNVDIVYASGFNPRNDAACGDFRGNTITLYEKVRVDGVPKTCLTAPFLTDTIAHELGHLLGLEDQYSGGCGDRIMAQGAFTPGGAYIDRSVRPEECRKVAETNMTPAEQYAAECAANPSLCPPDNQCGYIPEDNWCHSPIVVDLQGDGFEFSGPGRPVLFDMDGDSLGDKTCWTGQRTDDAFLAWDRNRNGWIDDGTELFGNATPLLSGVVAQNGYQVLFELDLVRGNANGYLDSQDQDFADMLLWRDRNHDGRSQPGELTSLAETRIYALSVEFRVSLEQDGHGNRLRFRSVAFRSGDGKSRPQILPTVDVFFAPGR